MDPYFKVCMYSRIRLSMYILSRVQLHDSLWYIRVHISWNRLFCAGNQSNHQKLNPFLLTYKCWLIFMGMKQKKNQNGRLKKTEFFFKYFFMKISEIGPWVSRINWYKGQNFTFVSSPWKSVNIYRLARMCENFDDYPGFQ